MNPAAVPHRDPSGERSFFSACKEISCSPAEIECGKFAVNPPTPKSKALGNRDARRSCPGEAQPSSDRVTARAELWPWLS